MDNQQATDAELGWFAGIIDGEGWLGMTISHDWRGGGKSQRNKKTVKVELKITNCDEAIIDKAVVIMRKLGVNPYRREHKQLSHMRRPVYECSIKNMTNVERAILPIVPFLTGNKQQRAQIILRFIHSRRGNSGVPNPAYANGGKVFGPRTIRPYTQEEMELVRLCRDLQSRGASETTRENRDKAVKALIAQNAPLLTAALDKI